MDTDPSRTLTAQEFRSYIAPFVDLEHLTLAVEVVTVCSLRCPGCWVSMARSDLWANPPARTMSAPVLEATLVLGRELGARRLTLLGGEPTMHPDLPEVIRQGMAVGYEVSVTTNGVCSTPRLLSILASGVRGISFSLDGSSAALHDELRPAANGRTTFARTVESIRVAVMHRAALGYRVCVNHTIFPRNLGDAEAMIRFSASLGVDHVRLHFTLPGDSRGPDGAPRYLDPEAWRGLVTQLPMLEAQLGIEIAAVPGYGVPAVEDSRARRSPYLTVQPGGGILLCASYARLEDRDRQTIGRLLPTGEVLINPWSPILGREHPAQCCGAIPMVLAARPEDVRRAVESAGGIGCAILQGPLVARHAEVTGDR